MHLQDCNIVEVLPAAKPYKLADGKGLYLLVQPSGTKLWRHKYRFYGIERKQSLGRWPEISLEVARQKRDEARDMIADGHDPVAMKRQAELEARISAASTFKAIAEEYIEKMRLEGRKAATLAKARWLLRVIDTRIGHRPINEITPHELLAALRVIEARGHRETAHRLPVRSVFGNWLVPAGAAVHLPTQERLELVESCHPRSVDCLDRCRQHSCSSILRIGPSIAALHSGARQRPRKTLMYQTPAEMFAERVAATR